MKNEYSKRTNEPETPLKSPPKRKPTRHLTRKKAGKTRIFRSSEPLAKMYPLSRGALKRLAPEDAKLLLDIAAKSQANRQRVQTSRYLQKLNSDGTPSTSARGLAWIFATSKKPFNLSLTVLKSLQLIEEESSVQFLSKFGEAFLAAVGEQSDPS